MSRSSERLFRRWPAVKRRSAAQAAASTSPPRSGPPGVGRAAASVTPERLLARTRAPRCHRRGGGVSRHGRLLPGGRPTVAVGWTSRWRLGDLPREHTDCELTECAVAGTIYTVASARSAFFASLALDVRVSHTDLLRQMMSAADTQASRRRFGGVRGAGSRVIKPGP